MAGKVRHGGVLQISGEEREELLSDTWDVVNRFLDALDK